MSDKPLKQALRNKPNEEAQGHESDLEASAMAKFLSSSWTKSISLHGLILASLLISFNFSAKPLMFASDQLAAPSPKVDIVQATFIDSNVIEQSKREKAQAEAAAQKRLQEKRREDAARKERLRKKRIEDENKKKAAEQKEQARQDKLREEQRKEQEIKARQEQERKEREAQQERQQALEKEMAEQLEKEQQAMSQANQRRIMSEVDKYKALVYSKVKRNLETDGGFIGESCTVSVRLAPDGLVLQVAAQSGNAALCRIAEAAVLKAGTLPVSKDPEVMAEFRNFNIEVRPEK